MIHLRRMGMVVILVAIVYSVKSMADPYDDCSFDSQQWESGERAVRSPMARAACREITVGMSGEEVILVLGECDGTEESQAFRNWFGEYFPHLAVTTWLYRLDGSYFYDYDDAFVYVHFDGSGYALKAEIGGG